MPKWLRDDLISVAAARVPGSALRSILPILQLLCLCVCAFDCLCESASSLTLLRVDHYRAGWSTGPRQSMVQDSESFLEILGLECGGTVMRVVRTRGPMSDRMWSHPSSEIFVRAHGVVAKLTELCQSS